MLLVLLYRVNAYFNTTISTITQTHNSNNMCLCHFTLQLGSLLTSADGCLLLRPVSGAGVRSVRTSNLCIKLTV